MCARYARWTADEALEEFSDLRLPPEPLPATYNAAPQSMQPIIRVSAKTGEPEIVMARWGLIPFWAKDAKIAHSTINARSEEIERRPAFREPLKSRRCLIPANCYYEWQQLSAKEKQPYAIGMKNHRPFAFAGLWDRWKAPDGALVESFTINTTLPNALTAQLHVRMPCILEPAEYRRWLEPEEGRLPMDLLRPYPAEKMRYWPVGKAVGNVRNDDPALCKPVALPARGGFLF